MRSYEPCSQPHHVLNSRFSLIIEEVAVIRKPIFIATRRIVISIWSFAVCGPALAMQTGSDRDITLEMVQSIMNPVDAVPGGYDYAAQNAPLEDLGRNLFFDKIIGGNMNISCATCHHPFAGSSDGLSLPVGEGAMGVATSRDCGTGDDAVVERVPRNSPHLFNLGAPEFTRMFHDGRVEADPSQPSGFISPAGDDLPHGLHSALAAQAMFPPTSGTEMAGQEHENPVGAAAAAGDLAGSDGVWAQLAQRVASIDEYVDMLTAAYEDVNTADDITFVHIANAIAAYEAAAYRSENSPYDRYLRHERAPMGPRQIRGMQLFNGRAGCVDCHSGPYQTDHEFYSVAMPQIGPGTGDNQPGYNDGHDDFGREKVTGDPADRFRFRTPSLRNVAMTGPWGHDGAFNSLEAVVRQQLDPYAGMEDYDTTQARLPPRPDLDAQDFIVHNDPARRGAIVDTCELQPIRLNDRDVADLIEFLHALTDPAFINMRDQVPMRVPSGLPIFD